MSHTNSPAFQFYPGDWLKSERIALMRLDEEGAYLRALLYCWTHGTLPADAAKLAYLIGKGCSVSVASTVAAMFQPDPGDPTRLRHDRLDEEREKQAAWRQKSRKGGKKGAKKRWEKHSNQGMTTPITKASPPPQPPPPPNDGSSVFGLRSSVSSTALGSVDPGIRGSREHETPLALSTDLGPQPCEPKKEPKSPPSRRQRRAQGVDIVQEIVDAKP